MVELSSVTRYAAGIDMIARLRQTLQRFANTTICGYISCLPFCTDVNSGSKSSTSRSLLTAQETMMR